MLSCQNQGPISQRYQDERRERFRPRSYFPPACVLQGPHRRRRAFAGRVRSSLPGSFLSTRVSVKLGLGPCGLILVSVFASRDRDGNHGAQQAPGAGAQHLGAGAEHHGRGEERRHWPGQRPVEQVVARAAGGLPPSQPLGAGGRAPLLSLWDVVEGGALAGCPQRISQASSCPRPLPMASSASRPSRYASPPETRLLSRGHRDTAGPQGRGIRPLE